MVPLIAPFSWTYLSYPIEGESLDQVFVKELISQTVDYYSFLSWEEMESESDEYESAASMPDDSHLFPIDSTQSVLGESARPNLIASMHARPGPIDASAQ